MATVPALKLIYLVEELGEYGLLPDGAIVNVGGVQGPNFLIGGKALLFSDGSTTDGSGVSTNIARPDFQTVYQNSVGEAFIDFTSGKDFVFQAVNNKQFRFDADTGEVTISGDLTVLGDTITVTHAVVNTDQITIHQSAGNYTPFIMEPIVGVVPIVNVVDIKVAYSGASVFTIGPTGTTFIQSLNTGLINGIDLNALAQTVSDHDASIAALRIDLNSHLEPTGIKHTAAQVSANTEGLSPVSGTDVQEVIESINTALSNIIATVSNVKVYEHVQLAAQDPWTITHSQDSRRIQITVWDSSDEVMIPAKIKIVDSNNVSISYGVPVTGRAILMLF